MSEFSERVYELMIEQGLDRKTLAQKLNIKAASLTQYLTETHLPTVDNLIKIADFFKRSTDFLLGREEENNSLTFKTCPPFNEQLTFLKKHFQCSAYQIYNNTNISKSCYYEWVSGRRKPLVENIIKLAEHFDCRVDFVLGRES